jgi:hypothetical protein
MTKWGMPETQIYLWTDTGAFRSQDMPVTNWPQPNIVSKILDKYPISWSAPHIAGGFFGGSKVALARWLVLFTEMHDHLLADKKFVGKDQLVMDATALTHIACA